MGGMVAISTLVLFSLCTVLASGVLLLAATCAWFSALLGELSCSMGSGGDDYNAREGYTLMLFEILDQALVNTNFGSFKLQDATAYCNHESLFLPETKLVLKELVLYHTGILLISSCALHLGQVIFFTVMVDNHRVARIAATGSSGAAREVREHPESPML